MSPHQGWLPPPNQPQFWPSEPPPGLGTWGRQTEHRLEAMEHHLALGNRIMDKLDAIEERLDKLEAPALPPAPAPTASSSTNLADLLASQNVRLLLALIAGAVSTVATGKLPDLGGLVK